MGFKRPSKQAAKGGKQYHAIKLPDDMDSCSWRLRFTDIKWVQPENRPTGLFAVNFAVVSTDAGVRAGETAVYYLNPYQAHAETYVYRTLFDMIATLRGKAVSEETRTRYRKKINKKAAQNSDGGVSIDDMISMMEGLDGRTTVCVMTRKPASKGEGYWTTWEPDTEGDDE